MASVVLLIVLLLSPTAWADSGQPFEALSYSPSGVSDFADLARGIPESRIRADLSQLAAVTKAVRIYTVNQGLDRVPAVAGEMGMKVTLGLWVGFDPQANAAEIARAIAAVRANRSTIQRVIVGNECIEHLGLKPAQLIAMMETVRRGIGPGIPVGTADIWPVWLREPKLAAASDFVGAHIIPYWDGVSAKDAAPYVLERVRELERAYPGKPVLIAETGWPTQGPARDAAVPSAENQSLFIAAFRKIARVEKRSYVMLEAYDQPWKAAAGDRTYWGLFDMHGVPKANID